MSVSTTPTSSSSSESGGTPVVTPTRELAESSNKVSHFKNSSSSSRRSPSASQPTIPSHLEGGDSMGGAPPGILLSPQLRRTPRSTGLGLRASFSSPTSTVSSSKPIYRSDSLQSFSAVGTKRVSPGRQGFLQSKAPSVASRILQFEPTNSPRGNNGGVGVANNSSNGMGVPNNGVGVACSSSGGVSPTDALVGGGSSESKTETIPPVSDLKQSTGTVSFL